MLSLRESSILYNQVLRIIQNVVKSEVKTGRILALGKYDVINYLLNYTLYIHKLTFK